QIPQKWYFTGLYAPPGKSIEISIDSANSEDLQSLQVLIGPHIDNIIDGATMRPNGTHPGIITRFPKVFANFTGLKLGKNNFRNPYGGLLILRGFKNKPSLQNIDLTIKGCIEAPYIKSDTTKEKLDHFKSLNVPWGVIEASRAVLVVPKSTIAEIPNPSSPGQSPPHIKALDFVYEKLYDLLGFKSGDPNPLQRPWVSKHWHVIDLQISAGYAHSGFPAMYHSDWANLWKSPSEIQGNDWGLYHEQGHNWQYSANKTSVDGEVTNNLFSEYMYTLAGHPRSKDNLDLRFLDDLRSDNISYYSGDVWHSLCFWVQMIFYIERNPLPNKIGGWDIVRTHYRYTRALNDTQRNLEGGFSNTQKDNQLCLLFSQWTGYNLVSYFNKYKRTINAETQSKINALNLRQPSPEIWAFDPFAPR
ncbi:MAG: M60 family metallopeptidase, partial [Bacteriovoracales bacterium]